jgi:hypothetical protein
MINLIPATAKASLIKEYWMRAVTVWFFLWSVAVLLGMFILIPSYVLTHSQVTAYKDSAASATEKIANYEAVSKELSRAGVWAGMMKDNFALPETSKYIALFRSFEKNGISISQIAINRGDKGIEPILITGTAENRQTLAAFRDNLVAEEVISSVDLPLSNLAKDRDIPFEVTVTIDNTKKP